MAESEPNPSLNDSVNTLAKQFGQSVLGRVPSAEETNALATIFKATAQALKHGFIVRLAEQVQTERETESVEEFFENIKPD